MVYFRSFLGAAMLSTLVVARPMQYASDNSYGSSAADMSKSSSTSSVMHESAATSSTMMHESAATAKSSMMKETSSSMMHETTSSSMMMETSSVMMSETTSAATVAATSSVSSYDSSYGSSSNYGSSNYGSGSSNWGGSNYNDCVNQCIASFGSPAQSWMPTATSGSSGSYGSSGSGATHTVIVAPTQGTLRFVPFAVNASVGDTVKFMWGANTHTVTKGSALLPCNKTADALFTSGSQDKGFVFTQLVNSTDPTYYFCNTPGHCQKGMFGMINPPSAWGASTSVGAQIGNMTSTNSDVAAMVAYTSGKTQGNAVASGWGKNIDLAALPDWAHQAVVENTMYVRTLIAANPDIVNDNGVIDLGAVGTNPLMIPQDISVALASSGATTSSSAPATAPTGTAAATPSPATNAESATGNGAISTGSSKILVAATVLVATFFLL